jgi:hypothetical protein
VGSTPTRATEINLAENASENGAFFVFIPLNPHSSIKIRNTDV